MDKATGDVQPEAEAASFLARMTRLGVTITLRDDGRLEARPAYPMTVEDRLTLARLKPQLVAIREAGRVLV